MDQKIILIVDDQPELRKLVRMTLECDDYELHEAKKWTTSTRISKIDQTRPSHFRCNDAG